MLNTFTLASLLAQLFLAALSSEETCTDAATGAGNCLTGKCDVWIGGQKYCSQCAADGEGPIDGICKSDKAGNTCDNKVCTSCANGYFLHKGGCYQIGGTVGLLICADATPSDLTGTAGKCATCAAGYFKNPANVAAGTPPCIACNDTTGNSGNKGIGKCSTCTIESSGTTSQTAKCTKCQGTDYLKSDGTACGDQGTVCTSNTEFAKEDAANGNKCVSCGDQTDGVEGCNTCTYDSGTKKPACTKCADPNYLKTVDGTTTCVEKTACKDDFFPVDDSTNGHKCVSCDDETGVTDASNKKWNGVANCTKCTQPSAAGTAKCTACASGFNLEGETCVSSSANRSALSTGAIAGISVAAVVVVGGLVGFLCWWFVCRGKA